MAAFDLTIGKRLSRALLLPRWWRRFRETKAMSGFRQVFSELLPKGLYARALLIIITPIVVLEGVIAFAFMERHWQAVTRRLSEATARDIAALIEVYNTLPKDDRATKIVKLAKERLNLRMDVMPAGELPPPGPKPFFALLDRALSNELRRHVQLPFWIDTSEHSKYVNIRVKHNDAILGFIATRSQTYASNSHIFLLWMVGTSVILLTVAILFLRNQIRPILRLAEAAEEFGKGRTIPDDFKPRGAREVRQAATAFLQMRDRITTHVEQRTTMLAGVSHDLRTVLTRFKLELALLDDTDEARSLSGDVDEMQQMLEDYLAFAKGDGGEETEPTDLKELLEEISSHAENYCDNVELRLRTRRRGDWVMPLKRHSLKRAIMNLVTNAARFGDQIVIRASAEGEWVRIEVDDNGPGIPEEERENVFKPFYRLDHARNQDKSNSGLGLAIARDIARSHGGDLVLGASSLGGLRATFSLPF